VLERVRNRLGRWKGKYISMVGHLYLIKFVFSPFVLFVALQNDNHDGKGVREALKRFSPRMGLGR